MELSFSLPCRQNGNLLRGGFAWKSALRERSKDWLHTHG